MGKFTKMENVVIEEHKKFKAEKNAYAIVGLPGVGLVGRLVAEYIVNNTPFEKVASIYSDAFPPQVVSTPDSTVHVLRDEVYKVKKKGKALFVVVGDAQPSLPPQGFFNAQHLFSRDLAGLLKKLGCSRVFTVAGVPDPERAFKGPEVNIVATTKDLFKELKGDYKKYGAGLPINGAAGLVMQYSSVLGMQSACLIGSTSPQVQYPDFGSAAAVLSVLEKSVGMGLDEKMLGKKAKEFEKKLQEMVSVSQQQPVMEIPRGYEFPKQQEEDKFGGKYPGYIT